MTFVEKLSLCAFVVKWSILGQLVFPLMERGYMKKGRIDSLGHVELVLEATEGLTHAHNNIIQATIKIILGTNSNGSQKIIRRRILHRNPSSLIRSRIKNLETLPQILIQFQNTRHIPASITVIGCRPHRHQSIVKHTSMSLHDELVRSSNEIQVVPLIEHGHNISSKQIPRSPRRQTPSVDLFRIRPHEIAHGSIVRHLLLPINDAYLIQRINAGTESSVHGEYLVFDDGREREIIEYLRAIPPNIDAPVLSQTFVVKSVHLRDLTGFVIAADEGDPIGIPHFQCQEEQEGFDGVIAAVDEVSQEEVVFVGAFSPHFEEFNEVVELTVDVAAYLVDIFVVVDRGEGCRVSSEEGHSFRMIDR